MLSEHCYLIITLVSAFGKKTVFRLLKFKCGEGCKEENGSEVPLSVLEISDKIQL